MHEYIEINKENPNVKLRFPTIMIRVFGNVESMHIIGTFPLIKKDNYHEITFSPALDFSNFSSVKFYIEQTYKNILLFDRDVCINIT